MPISFDDNDDVKIKGSTDDTLIGNIGDRLKSEVLDVSNGAGLEGSLTVGTTAVAVRVGGSNLANRRYVTVFHNDNQDLYWGRTSGVTTSTGTPIFKSQLVTFRVGPDADIYLISNQAGQDVRITESS